jgi:hypothetical protein
MGAGAELRPTGCPSPGPSPFVPHGEGRIRSRFGWLRERGPRPAGAGRCLPQRGFPRRIPRSSRKGGIRSRCDRKRVRAAGAPSGLAPLAHLPQNCWGRLGGDGSKLDEMDRATSEAAPLSPSRRGEFDPAPDSLSSASPSPAQFAGRAGVGGARGRSSTQFEAPHSGGNPNLPQQFWGRCEPERAEGAPRTQFDLRRRTSLTTAPPHRAPPGASPSRATGSTRECRPG